jgi:hypothetical protein
MTDLTPATDVVVEPTGELLGDDLQEAIHDLDTRAAKSRPIDDVQVAMTITDDFMGNTPTSGRIGTLGWTIGPNGTGGGGTVAYSTLTSRPGVVRLGVDGATATWVAINLGVQLYRTPVFVQETLARIEKENDATGSVVARFGLGNNLNAQESHVGYYFSYGPSPDEPNGPQSWCAVCAVGGVRERVPINMPAVPPITGWHRFRITSDGAELILGNSLVHVTVLRYYVDDITQPVAEIVTNTQSSFQRYAPIIGIRRTAGTDTQRGLFVDSYQLRWETTRYEAEPA